MIIPVHKGMLLFDVLLISKETIESKKEGMLLFDVLLVSKETIQSKKEGMSLFYVLLVSKETIELKKEVMLLFYSASTESIYQDKVTIEEIWTREMRTDQIKNIKLKAMELTPKEVAAAQDLLTKRMSLLEYEDERSKTQIPLDILVKGKMNSNMIQSSNPKF